MTVIYIFFVPQTEVKQKTKNKKKKKKNNYKKKKNIYIYIISYILFHYKSNKESAHDQRCFQLNPEIHLLSNYEER